MRHVVLRHGSDRTHVGTSHRLARHVRGDPLRHTHESEPIGAGFTLEQGNKGTGGVEDGLRAVGGVEREAVRVRLEGVEREEREPRRVRTQRDRNHTFRIRRGEQSTVVKATMEPARGKESCEFDGGSGEGYTQL